MTATKPNPISILALCVLWAVMPKDATAQDKPPAYEAMSLEELLNFEVSTATKTRRKIDDVPSVVEIITEQQIEQRGYRHLADVLEDIPDNHVDRSNWGIGEPLSQNTAFGFRFDTGQNILLLFNGQRLNAFLPGNRFGGEEYLLDNVDRIEVVRGPGSALYGANAFTTIVNVISKSGFSAGESAYFRLGSEGVFSSSGFGVHGSGKAQVGAHGFLSGAFRTAREEGQRLSVGNSVFGDAQLKDGVNYAFDSDLFFSFKNLRTYVKLDRQERESFTGFNGVNPPENDALALFMYAYSWGADYTRRLSTGLELKALGGWHQDNWTESGLIPMFQVNETGDGLVYDSSGEPVLDTVSVTRDGESISTSFVIDGQGADTRTVEGEVQLTWNYTKENDVILGLVSSYDQVLKAQRPSEIQIAPFEVVEFQTFEDDANNWLFDTAASRTTMGLYGQFDYDLGPSLVFTAGARVDQYRGSGALDQTYTEFNPRGGLVFRNRAMGNVKLMYGSATRIPNGFETLSSVAILGSPLNRPETIETIQALWVKNWSEDVRTELGGFRSVVSKHLVTDADISDALKAQGYIGQFRNLSGLELRSNGIDGKLSLRLREKVEAFLNFTRDWGMDDGTGEEIGYVPKTMVNGNVNVPFRWLNLNVGAHYRGDFTQPPSDPREAVAGYLLLNVTLLAKPKTFPLELSFGARNLLDADVRYPSSSVAFREHFPGRGLEIWTSVTFTFR
jgi:iron complex outermembrane receptor protein